jgi:hypothetical protein
MLAAAWVYAGGVLGVWMFLAFGGDRWWPATLLLFGPRWLCGLPLLALVPLAVWVRRRMILPLLAAAVLLVGPIMGLCIPWGRLCASSEPTIRLPAGACTISRTVNGRPLEGTARPPAPPSTGPRARRTRGRKPGGAPSTTA